MWKYSQHSFAGGIQDVRLIGRQDIERYAISARTIENFQVMRQGSIIKRRGTDEIKALGLANAEGVRLIPFVYERDKSYVFVFAVVEGECKVLVYDCGSAVEVASLSGPSLKFSPEDLKSIRWVQTGDVVVITHRNHPPIRITRNHTDGETSFSVDTINFRNLGGAELPVPPVINVTTSSNPDANGAPRTVYYAATAVGVDGRESDMSKAVSVTYNLPWTNKFIVTISVVDKNDQPLETTPEGISHYNIYKKTSGEFGFIGTTKGHLFEQKEIETGKDENGNPIKETITVSSLAEFQDDYITPDTSLTPPKREDFFSVKNAYPSTVALADQRLVFAATERSPYTIWWSTVGDLFNFNEHESVRDDDGFSANIPATELPRVNHIISTRDMLIFSDGAEWVAEPVSGEVLTLKTLTFKQQSQVGASASLAPTMIEGKVVFADSTQETVHTIDYSLERDGYKTQNVTILSQSLFDGNPIRSWAYAQCPDSTLWCVLDDGTIATLAYMQEHELAAWSHQVLGGGMRAVDICCTKEVRNGCSAVFILAKRANGELTLLRVRDDVEPTTIESALCLDAMRIVCPEEDITVGRDEVAYNSTTGALCRGILAQGVRYCVGYPFDATFRSVTPEAQGQSTIQFELKDAVSAELRLRNVATFSIVPTSLEARDKQEVVYKQEIRSRDCTIKMESKDLTIELAGHSNISGAITLKCDAPYPLTLLSMSINYELDPRTIGVN